MNARISKPPPSTGVAPYLAGQLDAAESLRGGRVPECPNTSPEQKTRLYQAEWERGVRGFLEFLDTDFGKMKIARGIYGHGSKLNNTLAAMKARYAPPATD